MVFPYNNVGNILDGYRLGTNAYVVKPVAFDRFIGAIKYLGAFWGIINEPPVEKNYKLN